ncbi:MAG TPA: hypothetical protein VI451_08370 [Anaerolineales bacterium]|nr:hypothetical protein [Anaerolineales bacterium]
MERTLTLTLPDYVYQELQNQAKATTRPLDEVASQVIIQNLAPKIEEDLPPALRAELDAMSVLSDETIWQIADSQMNQDKVALYDVLLERLKNGSLTPEGQELLTDLRNEADALMLRKAHAYTLLKSRGHKLPSLDELRARKS